jgi:NAD-dependent deacetylase sirtuin 4
LSSPTPSSSAAAAPAGVAAPRILQRDLSPPNLPRVRALSELGPSSSSSLLSLVLSSNRLLVITGAGVSTTSGIPDYRSPGRAAYKPLSHSEFMTNEHTRRRYWARSTIGFRHHMGEARANVTHHTLAWLERAGKMMGSLITQNVDRLHQQAGHKDVLELHGTIHEVECLECGHRMTRRDVQASLEGLNVRWLDRYDGKAEGEEKKVLRPDGDIELPSDAYHDFRVPPCPRCGGFFLKPAVVFHGGSVPDHVTSAAIDKAKGADGVLLVGTTASTFSAFRLVRHAKERGAVVGILNFGPTRADPLASFKIEASVGDVLGALKGELEQRGVGVTG